MNPLHHIDLRRLAGIRRVLGVDLTDSRARIVELERKGNPFNRFKPKFTVRKSLTIDFDTNSDVAGRAETLRSLLRQQEITTPFAVTSVQSLGIKIVISTLTSDARN